MLYFYAQFFTFCYSLKRFYYYTEGINTPASGAKGIRRQIRQRGSAPPRTSLGHSPKPSLSLHNILDPLLLYPGIQAKVLPTKRTPFLYP